ncbi:MAG: uroporphyrinogen-III synthase [Armatimonadetes bacterium]|nr:uroporphyrinogen-III synthase [Armatimonadota bacterium]
MISLIELDAPTADLLSLKAYRRIQAADAFCGPTLPRLEVSCERCPRDHLVERGRSQNIVFLASRDQVRELIPELEAAGISWELIPSVSPMQAALVHSGLDPGRDPVLLVEQAPAVWDPALEIGGTLVVAGGDRDLSEVARELEASGLPPAGRILAAEPSGRLVDREDARVRWLLVTSRPTSAAEGWVDRLPLSGRSIVVTREQDKAEELALTLERLGAEAVRCPTLRFEAPVDPAPAKAAIQRLGEYGWILFTSPNGVRFFVERLWEEGADLRSLGAARLAAIGPATAEALESYRLRADVIPEEYVAEGLLEALAAYDLSGKRVLVPRAAEAREVLPERLRERGASVDVVPVYRTTVPPEPPPEIAARLQQGVDLITFTSSSTVKHFHQLIGARLDRRHLPVLSIGPITAATARELGYEVVATARRYTVEGMLETMLERFAR